MTEDLRAVDTQEPPEWKEQDLALSMEQGEFYFGHSYGMRLRRAFAEDGNTLIIEAELDSALGRKANYDIQDIRKFIAALTACVDIFEENHKP